MGFYILLFILIVLYCMYSRGYFTRRRFQVRPSNYRKAPRHTGPVRKPKNPSQTKTRTDRGLHQIKPKHTGVALIIGNSYTRKGLTFTKRHRQLPALHGALKDTELMKEAFQYLNFFTVVKHNMTQTELISFLYEEVKHHNYPKSCQRFVLTFSGHGGDGFIYSEDEKNISINEIVAAFTPNSSNDPLTGIPRLFFFDTCRGDLEDPGIIARGGDEKWQSKIPSTGDVLVAYATTPGYKAFEGTDGGLWTSILAKKLVSSPDSIYDTLTEVNRELICKTRDMQGPSFQQPELVGRLNTSIHLLRESGQSPKFKETDAILQPQLGSSGGGPKSQKSIGKGGAVGNQYKSLLKERYCDKRQLSAPKYNTKITSGGFVSTVNVPQYKPVRGAVGNSEKEAEQLAAMEASKQLKLI